MKAIKQLMADSKGPQYKINFDKEVKVYFNLTKKCFSVLQDGLVKAHLNRVFLKDPKFVVNESGRQRVLKQKRKNVHAFVVGKFPSNGWANPFDEPKSVSYNPYRFGYFYDTSDLSPVESAKWARLEGRKIIVY